MNKYLLITIPAGIAMAAFCMFRDAPVKPISVIINKKCVVCHPASNHKSPTAPAFKTAIARSKRVIGEMVLVKGGSFQMGSDEFGDAMPVHRVSVSSFFMDVHEVTNAEFAEFVKETGYITTAERMPRKEDYPDVPGEKLVMGSAVFCPPSSPVSLENPLQWWQYVPGANWKHPRGNKS